MKLLLIPLVTLLIVILFPSLLFNEPSIKGQSTIVKSASNPTTEQQQARILNKLNNKKSDEINADLKSAIVDIDNLKFEKERLRKSNNSLTKEIQYLKQRIVNEKKKFAQYSLSVKNEDKITYLQDSSDYLTPDTIVCRIDTIYIKKKNLFNKIFGNK